MSGGGGGGFGASRVLETRDNATRVVTAMVAGAQDRVVAGSAEQSTAHEVSYRLAHWYRPERGSGPMGSMMPPQHGQMSSRHPVSWW